MTDIKDITPESPKATLTLNTATKAETTKPEGRIKPTRTRVNAEPKKEEVEDDAVWIKLVRGGTYGYKRAIYEEGKTYEVTKAIADHLLQQCYSVGGNGQEVIDVYYFQRVPKKK